MAKKKRTVKNPAEETKVLIGGGTDVKEGRFANHVKVMVQDEEVVLDFISRAGDQGSLVARVFMVPDHAERLAKAISEGVRQHKKLLAKTKRRKKR